jgi:hypothetical protein
MLGVGGLFDRQDEFLLDINAPAGLQFDSHSANRFADNVARNRDLALADNKEQYRDAIPGGINRGEISGSIEVHWKSPFLF